MPLVLAIDDERSVHLVIAKALEPAGFEFVFAASGQEALSAAGSCEPNVILLDVMLPDISGLELFTQLRSLFPRVPIVIMTVSSDSHTAIESMKLGALDFLVKPLDVQQLREVVTRAIEIQKVVAVENEAGEQPLGTLGDAMIGQSRAMLDVYKAIGQVASEDVAVLISGESGTGKELVARAIYQHSHRANAPFLAVNCPAIPEHLLESELFGHEKGAFTSASSRRIGKFEQCAGGTIFLDEVGDMALSLQGKVLRLLQEKQFERVGGNQTLEADVRIIAATNRDLERMCEAGTFRSDLFFRLNGFDIKLPPLRERGSDVLLLIQHFLSKYQKSLAKNIEGLASETVQLLSAYEWPGNIRELQNVLRQAMLQSTGPLVLPDCLPQSVRGGAGNLGAQGDRQVDRRPLIQFVNQRLKEGSNDLYAETLQFMERALLTRILEETDGNQSEASRILGITRGSVRNKIRALDISIGKELVISSRQ